MFESEAQRPVQLVPSHGDFGPGQILATEEQISLVDLDGFAHSDAALDVANVLVGLQVHAGMEARELGQRFLQTYLSERGVEALPGLPHYRAFAWLRRAMILLRRRPAGWEEHALHLLGRARQSL
jgi:thiamine kinase-like enzyme